MPITSDEIHRRRLTAMTAVRCVALGVAAYGLYAFLNLATAILMGHTHEDPTQWWWLLHMAYGLSPWLVVHYFPDRLGSWLVPPHPSTGEPPSKRDSGTHQRRSETSVADVVAIALRFIAVTIVIWLVYIALRVVADYFTFKTYWQTDPNAAAGWITMEMIEFIMLSVIAFALLRNTREIAEWLSQGQACSPPETSPTSVLP